MPYLSTGQAARLPDPAEPKLAQTVGGHPRPVPRAVAAPRLWTHEQPIQAACPLGGLTPRLRTRTAEEVARA